MRISWLLGASAALYFCGCSTSNVIAEDDGGAGSGSDSDGTGGGLPDLPDCEPQGDAETNCMDDVDDDCDGFVDCLDSECGGQQCSSDASLTCMAGACLGAAPALPELPELQNVRVFMNASTARVEFEPVAGALDYRIYPLPDDEDILVGEDGEVVVQDAIYRCAGDRPFTRRADDPAGFYDASLTA